MRRAFARRALPPRALIAACAALAREAAVARRWIARRRRHRTAAAARTVAAAGTAAAATVAAAAGTAAAGTARRRLARRRRWHGGGWHGGGGYWRLSAATGCRTGAGVGAGAGAIRAGLGLGLRLPGYYGYDGYYGGGYGHGYGDDAQVERWAAVNTDVSPEEARVFLDGRYIGTADDFDGYPGLSVSPARDSTSSSSSSRASRRRTIDVDAQPGDVKVDIKTSSRRSRARSSTARTTRRSRGRPSALLRQGEGARTTSRSAGRRGRDPVRAPSAYEAPSSTPTGARHSGQPSRRRCRRGRRAGGTRHAPRAAVGDDVPPARGRAAGSCSDVQPADAAVYLDDRSPAPPRSSRA